MAQTDLKAPRLLILNQMAGPMTWELAEDAGEALGCVAMLTGHPDTLAKGSTDKVRLFPAATYKRGSFARRALSWIQYGWQAFFWLWRWPQDIPVLMFSNPPVLCWLGWLMKMLRGQRYSVMVHDIYPNVLVSVGGFSERHPLIRFWRALNRHAYENADVVMTLGEFMAANLEKQFDARKTRPGKVEVVYPWVDTEKIKPMPKAENWFAQKHNQLDKLTVMYSGNMGLGHDIETMLEAARLLHDEPKIHFMFIGAGPKWKFVERAIAQHHLQNVTLLPWQPEETLPYSLACADVALVSLEPGMEGLALPSKAIHFMGAGASILIISNMHNELVGWAVNPKDYIITNSKRLASLLREILESSTLPDLRFSTFSNAKNLFERRKNETLLLNILNLYVL